MVNLKMTHTFCLPHEHRGLSKSGSCGIAQGTITGASILIHLSHAETPWKSRHGEGAPQRPRREAFVSHLNFARLLQRPSRSRSDQAEIGFDSCLGQEPQLGEARVLHGAAGSAVAGPGAWRHGPGGTRGHAGSRLMANRPETRR